MVLYHAPLHPIVSSIRIFLKQEAIRDLTYYSPLALVEMLPKLAMGLDLFL